MNPPAADTLFPVSASYRTIHSLKDHEVAKALRFVPAGASVLLDYGCHLGHLAIELASRHDALVYAVDNFTGTQNDDLMLQTIAHVTQGSMDFYDTTAANIREAEDRLGGYKGRIDLIRQPDFFSIPNLSLDFAFIDSSHRPEEAQEFRLIADLIRPGGVIGGHDHSPHEHLGVKMGIELIKDDFEWLDDGYVWFMRKKYA